MGDDVLRDLGLSRLLSSNQLEYCIIPPALGMSAIGRMSEANLQERHGALLHLADFDAGTATLKICRFLICYFKAISFNPNSLDFVIDHSEPWLSIQIPL